MQVRVHINGIAGEDGGLPAMKPKKLLTVFLENADKAVNGSLQATLHRHVPQQAMTLRHGQTGSLRNLTDDVLN
jgi:hypothetical protein